MGSRRLVLLVVPIVVLSVAGVLAAGFAPLLVRDHPLLLIALDARNRYLLLVSGKVGAPEFIAVAVARRFASDPFSYLLGRWYGDRAARWVDRRLLPGGRLSAATIEGAFRRVADVAVFLLPGALVCFLAGSTGMRPARFVSLNLIGTLLVVVAVRMFATAAAGPLGGVVRFNDRNAGWLTVLFIVGTAAWLYWRRRNPAE